jgi:hypothetical protein
MVLLVAMACSGSRSDESVSSTLQAVTNPITTRVLSFEQPTVDWSATGLNLRQGNQFFDGQHSAAVTVVSSGSKLNSVPLSSLGPISSTVTLEVRLPSYVASPTFQGQVALWLHSPTAGVFHQYFGPAQFSNAPTGVFRQVQFTLPPAIVTALSTRSYADLVASVEVDFNPNPNPSVGFSDPFYIDRLDFGQGSPPSGGGSGGGGSGGSGGVAGKGGGTGAGAGGATAAGNGGGLGAGGVAGSGGAHGGAGGATGAAGTPSAGAAGTSTSGPCQFTAQATGSATDVAFTIKLPVGVHREDVGLSATGGALTLADGVSVVRDGGGFASISSVRAASRTNLGVLVQVQDAYSEPTGIDLRSSAVVHGTLKTAADETTETGAIVDGATLQQTSLQPLESVTWTVSFPNTSHGSCSLEPDNTEVIDPGSYGDIAVKSRSHLKIRSGTYYFNSLSFEPQSVLEIDNRAGPVFIYVRTTLAFGGTVVEADPTRMNFLFGVAGTTDVNIQSAFRGLLGPGGVLIAPGSGADDVSSGDGDDTFVLYSECEATPGKKLLANGGFDTLISPLSIDELRARGVVVEGFESVIIRSDACKSDCTVKPTCGAGTQCADRGGQAVCGASTGSTCQTCNDCAAGLSCSGGTCQDPCVANPQAPGCAAGTPVHCSNGVRDADETDIDCGGTCAACPTGSGCATNADCGPDRVCGETNGACFGHARAQRVCWRNLSRPQRPRALRVSTSTTATNHPQRPATAV